MESIFTKKNIIEINMSCLGDYIKDLGFLRLIFGGRGLESHDGDNYICDDDDMTNILKLNVLNLFKNLQTLMIRMVQDHPFSLISIVIVIDAHKDKRGGGKALEEDSWLSCVWYDKSSSLIEAYKNNGYAIEFDHDVYGGYCLSIKLL